MSERLLRLRDVMAQTGLGSSTIYRYIQAGTFPAPLKIGGHSARWLQSAVDGWIENLIHRGLKDSGAGVPGGVPAAALAENREGDQRLRR